MALATRVRGGAAAQALAAVRVAHRRRGRTIRLAVTSPTIRRCRSTSIVAQLNIDMIGRNRDDKPVGGADTLYLVGSDRISSELDDNQPRGERALAEADDARLRVQRSERRRVALYAQRSLQLRGAKGIPVIFFTTGLHSDYHMPIPTKSPRSSSTR